jgi:FkbM family methyltransferase
MNDISRIQALFRNNQYHPRMRRQLFGTFLRLSLKRAVARRSTDVEKILGFRVAHINLKVLSQLFDEIFINAIYYFKPLTDRPFIIDCGSNIGMSILFFKQLFPKASIIGFEPEHKTFDALQENIRLNGLEGVEVHRKAVSDSDGMITIYTDSNVSGSLMTSIIGSRDTGTRQDLETVRLSHFINREVDLLKLDIEGAELMVLEDLAGNGKLSLIREMIIEYHHHMDQNGDEFSRFLAILEGNGFGYQVYSNLTVPFSRETFQDILVYAYRK